MEEEKFYTIILRHDDSTKWMINDPILALGEYGVEDDTHRIKRGDGRSKWSEISYEHFGLEYMITFNNLQGQVEDNFALTQALNNKVDKETFKDVQDTVVASINVTTEEGKIGRLTKITKDVVLGATKETTLLIQSEDQSIQGFWKVDENGGEILDLRANVAIDEYEPKRRYFVDHICLYDNKLYRAVTDFEAGVVFDPNQWVVLASLHSDDIRYDNKISGLESRTVKTAIDEVKDLVDEKLQMTRRPYKVYGTNEDGEQMLYDKDDLRTVDTVNDIKADPETKNIQIDANGINYDDSEETTKTIREVLDSKVDKTVAGEGAKIVRDVQIGYDEETGHIVITEDKVSLEDGSSETQTSEVNIASNTELEKVKEELQKDIDTKYNATNDLIAEEVIKMNDRMDNEVVELNTRIDNEVTILNTIIDRDRTDINTKVDNAVQTLNDSIAQEVSKLNDRVDEEVEQINVTIIANKNACDEELANTETKLQENIDTNKADIEARVDEEVSTLNNTIAANKKEINDRVTEEVKTINTAIITNRAELDVKVDNNKADIEDKLAKGLDAKIDKNIADSILVGIGVSTEPGEKLDEPTLKIVAKNTDTKTEIVKHIHFAEKGSINVTKENDHIVVDSRDIDLQVANNKAAIEANDLEINALQEHDVAHDTELALHSSQIANHETRMLKAEADIVRIDKDIANLDDKIEAEITDRKVADAALENDISRNALNIQTNKEDIRANADNIIELNNVLQENVTNLANSKLDKDFAAGAGDVITANVDLMELSNNNLVDAKFIGVKPKTKEVLTKNYILKSSDNTLVSKAIKDANGDIIGYDLATNLDIDVNYFVTSEILATTVPSTNTLQLSKLTATTKENVEVNDIVSDTEGTWARVQAIDTEAGTLTCVTFHKHAQAVWGTVKGDITEQTDLQEALDKKIDENIANALIASIEYRGSGSNYDDLDKISFTHRVQPTDGSGGHSSTPMVWAKSDSILITRGQGTNPITYKFKVQAEGVEFKPGESGLTSVLLSNAIRELKGLDDQKVLITDFEEFKTANTAAMNTLKAEIESSLELLEDTHSTDKNLLIAEDERLDAAKVEKTETADQVYGTDAEGNQTTFDKDSFGTVDTVNGKVIDDNKNIELTGEDILETSAEDAETLAVVLDNIKSVFTEMNAEYMPGNDYYSESILGSHNFVHYTHIASGVTLMGRVMQDFSADTTRNSVLESFKYDVELGNISLVGIPEQIPEGDEPVGFDGIIPSVILDGLWLDDESEAVFEAYDRDDNVIANNALKANDVTDITYNDMDYTQFNLRFTAGNDIDTVKENIYGLRISIIVDGEMMSQTFTFNYDQDQDTFLADRWPA